MNLSLGQHLSLYCIQIEFKLTSHNIMIMFDQISCSTQGLRLLNKFSYSVIERPLHMTLKCFGRVCSLYKCCTSGLLRPVEQINNVVPKTFHVQVYLGTELYFRLFTTAVFFLKSFFVYYTYVIKSQPQLCSSCVQNVISRQNWLCATWIRRCGVRKMSWKIQYSQRPLKRHN